MFPFLPREDAGAGATERLARALIAEAGTSKDNRFVPAGYTYLGQFIDHDITFDPMSKLQRDNDPDALADFRTPRFDLDSLYGSGPADQPFLYDSHASPPGVKLLVEGDDLPRNRQGRALIGDARNDENLILSQLHVLFVRFHNRVVDHVGVRPERFGARELFEEAQRIVRWHYQWIVMHDFLPKVAGRDHANVEREFYAWREAPFVPVEFSAAAFRFGHSMVRENYQLNGTALGVAPFDLGGFRALPPELTIEWGLFFEVDGPPAMHSMLIDSSLAKVLSHVPPDGAALARLNLERGRALGLPSGADVARAMDKTPLAEKDMLPDSIDGAAREALLQATPLWYYVLREAEILGNEGRHLGPVGGRIVAEVLAQLLAGDPSSYLREWPGWTPELPGAERGDFTMGDLVRFALGGG